MANGIDVGSEALREWIRERAKKEFIKIASDLRINIADWRSQAGQVMNDIYNEILRRYPQILRDKNQQRYLGEIVTNNVNDVFSEKYQAMKSYRNELSRVKNILMQKKAAGNITDEEYKRSLENTDFALRKEFLGQTDEEIKSERDRIIKQREEAFQRELAMKRRDILHDLGFISEDELKGGTKEHKKMLKDLEKKEDELRKKYFYETPEEASARKYEKKIEKRAKGKTFRGFFEEVLMPHIMRIIAAFALAFLGVVVSWNLGSTYFLWAFGALSLYAILPDVTPPEFSEKIILTLPQKGALKAYKKFFINKHSGVAALKSIVKVTAIVFFIIALMGGTLPFQNILLIIVAFAGYFWMKMSFDTPGGAIESTLRFFLGLFIIPFFVFYNAFGSLALAGIAAAFLGIPPLPKTEKSSQVEVTALNRMTLSIFFLVIMLVVLFGVMGVFPGGGWELTAGLQSVFLYFWVVCTLAGFASTAEARPVIGLLMLGGATVVFGLGPGAQNVGMALLGPWWPTVHNFFTNSFGPLTDAFGQIGTMFSNAWLLITNPVGYAQGLMNGTYNVDPDTGLAGAYGVELEQISVSPVYAQEPFVISMKIKNKGAYPAEDVVAYLYVPGGGGTEIKTEHLGIETGGETGVDLWTDPADNSKKYRKKITEPGEQFSKLYLEQVFFSSNGIQCRDIVEDRWFPKENKDLRNQYIPLVGMVSYDYMVDSQLPVEFISDAEWNSRVQAGEMVTQAKKSSQLTNSPVRLNLDTLEQPIREGVEFFIGIQIVSAKGTDSRLGDIKMLELEIPDGFEQSRDCSTPGAKNENKITWSGNIPKSGVIYCYFRPMKGKLTGPTQTFIINAHAEYEFMEWEQAETRFEFGGFRCCMSGDDCAEGEICGDDKVCRSSASETATPEETTDNGGVSGGAR